MPSLRRLRQAGWQLAFVRCLCDGGEPEALRAPAGRQGAAVGCDEEAWISAMFDGVLQKTRGALADWVFSLFSSAYHQLRLI